MSHRPRFEDFSALAPGHTLVPVFRVLTGDTLTPVTAFNRIEDPDWCFLFESVVGGERVGRYSFLGAAPFLQFESYDRQVRVRVGSRVDQFEHPDPTAALAEVLERYRAPHLPGLPRFCGGAVGYAGYDSVRYVERLPDAPPDDRHLPDLCFGLYDRMVIFDHINKTVIVVAHAHLDADAAEWRGAYDRACRAVDALVQRLRDPGNPPALADIDPAGRSERAFQSNFSRAEFEAAVGRCQEYINAGDIFQVVLSQRLRTETTARPFDIYRALRVLNPSPFMFFLRAWPLSLVGASPEVMVRVEDGTVTVRPLAGTRRRGATEAEDLALEAELLADPKERAEHVMLVDLARNDVGRVAEFGSVGLHDLMHVERYSHVMHLSSTVTGRLRPEHSALDALRMCLPAGTLSGAPKVRAMQVIDELEPSRRGPYGGAVGYIDFSGQMDTCIALRTMVLLGRTAYLQAGAGVVADSVPASEYEETLNKAMGLLKAIDVAEGQLSGG